MSKGSYRYKWVIVDQKEGRQVAEEEFDTCELCPMVDLWRDVCRKSNFRSDGTKEEVKIASDCAIPSNCPFKMQGKEEA